MGKEIGIEIPNEELLNTASLMFYNLFFEKDNNLGVSKICAKNARRVDSTFTRLTKLDSFKSIIEDTTPNFPCDLEPYLIFSPYASPKKCLAWLSEDGFDAETGFSYGSRDELTRRSLEAFETPHYCMYKIGGVYMWFDEEGMLWI